MSEKFNVKRFLITLGIILVTVGATAGPTWYFMDQANKEQQKTIESQNSQLEKLTVQQDVSTDKQEPTKENKSDEMSDWKIYSSSKYGFSFKYPSGWSIIENSKAVMDGSNYIGGVLFSNNNVVIDNKAKGYAIGINIDSEFGRGGTCAKRRVTYEANLANDKLNLVKKDDIIEQPKEGDMCYGQSSKGYTATVVNYNSESQPEINGHNYYFHSENNNLSDAVSNDAITYFEKILSTFTFN